jgi:hypothetical protein
MGRKDRVRGGLPGTDAAANPSATDPGSTGPEANTRAAVHM